MTKKKSSKKEDDQDHLEPVRRQVHSPSESIVKSRVAERNDKQKLKKKKKQDKLLVYNQMKAEDRKVQEQRYRDNLINKKIQQEKRGFLALKYTDKQNSQLAEMDEDSVSKRYENETSGKIRQLLQFQLLNQKKQHLSDSAQNQYAKVQKLTESLSQKHRQQTDMIDKVRSQDDKSLKLEQMMEMNVLFHNASRQKGENHEQGQRSILQKINQLQQIYY